MKLAIVMSVYNEEALMPRALESLAAAGAKPEDIFVFDGAWRGGKDGAHVFDGAVGPSTDATVQIADDFGCHTFVRADPWPSQEAKRTEMFRHPHPRIPRATHFFVFDADETLTGEFPSALPDGPANIMVRCIGPNDLPGIRGEWPHGDYSTAFKPELRFFHNTGKLECLYPGGYHDGDGMIEAYKGLNSALPVVEGLSMEHHGNDRSAERKAAKIAYYTEEHPQREKWQNALGKAGVR